MWGRVAYTLLSTTADKCWFLGPLLVYWLSTFRGLEMNVTRADVAMIVDATIKELHAQDYLEQPTIALQGLVAFNVCEALKMIEPRGWTRKVKAHFSCRATADIG